MRDLVALGDAARAPRFRPTLPAPTMITYIRQTSVDATGPTAASSISIAFCVGQTVEQALLLVPLRAHRVEHAHDHLVDLEAALGDLRDHEVGVVPVGGRRRTRRPARCPAASSASISSAVPTVNWPPWSSQAARARARAALSPRGPRRGPRPRGPGRSCCGRSPTRLGRSRRSVRTSSSNLIKERRPSRSRPPRPRRRRGEDHAAGSLLDHVTGRLPHGAVARPAAAAQQAPAAHRAWAPRRPARSPRRRAGAPPRRSPGRSCARAPIAVATSTPSYSSPTSFARASACLRLDDLLLRHARVERQRHRDLDHVDRLDHRAALALLGLLGRQPARRCRRCRRPAPRRRPARGSLPYSTSGASCSASAGIVIALGQRLALGRAGRST